MSIARELPESSYPLSSFSDADYERLFGTGWKVVK